VPKKKRGHTRCPRLASQQKRVLLFRLSELALHGLRKLAYFAFQGTKLFAEFAELTSGAADFFADGTPFFVQLFIFFLLLGEAIYKGLRFAEGGLNLTRGGIALTFQVRDLLGQSLVLGGKAFIFFHLFPVFAQFGLEVFQALFEAGGLVNGGFGLVGAGFEVVQFGRYFLDKLLAGPTLAGHERPYEGSSDEGLYDVPHKRVCLGQR